LLNRLAFEDPKTRPVILLRRILARSIGGGWRKSEAVQGTRDAGRLKNTMRWARKALGWEKPELGWEKRYSGWQKRNLEL
jgi:hypothetical protein